MDIKPIRDRTDIEQYKLDLYDIIDENTAAVIFQGFTFAGKPFSLSISAQINWTNLLQLPDAIYPLTISCKDETVYSLTLANKMNFYLTCVFAKNGALQAGTTLKQSVRTATTITELDVINATL